MMSLNTQQLEAIVARAFPGERLVESRELAAGRYALKLPGENLAVQLYGSAPAAATAAEALRRLRAEVDLPIPQLRASDPQGQTIGQPYLLLSDLAGEPLARALPRIGDEQLYALGRKLGEALCRVHRLACDRYGALAGDDPAAAGDERSYALARLERDLSASADLGLLDRQSAAEVRAWFEREFKPSGRQAALVCGGLRPESILVRQAEGRWWIGALLGWEHALGWCPAWEHATFLDAADGPRYFSLRVGYGNGYDEQTSRAYEQVREHVLTPYRVLLAAQRLREADTQAAGARLRELLKRLVRLPEQDTDEREALDEE